MGVTCLVKELGLLPSDDEQVIYQKMKELFFSSEKSRIHLVSECIYSLGLTSMGLGYINNINTNKLSQQDLNFERKIIVSFLSEMEKENSQALFDAIYSTHYMKNFYVDLKSSDWFLFNSLRCLPCVLFFRPRSAEEKHLSDLCSVYQNGGETDAAKMRNFLYDTKKRMEYYFDDGGFLERMKSLVSFILFDKKQVNTYARNYNQAVNCLFNDLRLLLSVIEFCELLAEYSNNTIAVIAISPAALDQRGIVQPIFQQRAAYFAKNVLTSSNSVKKAMSNIERLIEGWASEEFKNNYNAKKEKILLDSQLTGAEGSLRFGRPNKI